MCMLKSGSRKVIPRHSKRFPYGGGKSFSESPAIIFNWQENTKREIIREKVTKWIKRSYERAHLNSPFINHKETNVCLARLDDITWIYFVKRRKSANFWGNGSLASENCFKGKFSSSCLSNPLKYTKSHHRDLNYFLRKVAIKNCK